MRSHPLGEAKIEGKEEVGVKNNKKQYTNNRTAANMKIFYFYVDFYNVIIYFIRELKNALLKLAFGWS